MPVPNTSSSEPDDDRFDLPLQKLHRRVCHRSSPVATRTGAATPAPSPVVALSPARDRRTRRAVKLPDSDQFLLLHGPGQS